MIIVCRYENKIREKGKKLVTASGLAIFPRLSWSLLWNYFPPINGGQFKLWTLTLMEAGRVPQSHKYNENKCAEPYLNRWGETPHPPSRTSRIRCLTSARGNDIVPCTFPHGRGSTQYQHQHQTPANHLRGCWLWTWGVSGHISNLTGHENPFYWWHQWCLLWRLSFSKDDLTPWICF